MNRWPSFAPYLLSVLRIVAAFLFIQVGTAKILGFPAPIMPDGSLAQLSTLPGVAGLIESIGGPLMLLGLFTRPVGFILSGEMAVAYFYGHAPNGFWPVLNQGTDAVLYCFLWLYFSSVGAGPWSVDAALGRWKRADAPVAAPRPTS